MKITNDKKRQIVTIVLATIGASFLAAGIFSKEFLIVFGKAAKVCLECIGIG